jgi:broad specificity phosphatase PhoE
MSTTPQRTELLLVRHGETPWNAAGRWQGHGDPGLTDVGRRQAGEVATALLSEEEPGWHRIIASDLARARETAAILAGPLELSITIDVRLRELDVGAWTGLTREEILVRDRARLEAFDTGEPTVRPGGGESRIEIRQRVRACVEELAERFAGERLVVVTHLGVIRALVPGAEPTNGEQIAVVAEEIVARPIDLVRRPGDGPL